MRSVGEAGFMGKLERLLGRPLGAPQGRPQTEETQQMIDELHMMSPEPWAHTPSGGLIGGVLLAASRRTHGLTKSICRKTFLVVVSVTRSRLLALRCRMNRYSP